jgi:hypothetical protein
MSITRLQQARQMYALGQRVGGIMGSNAGSMLVTPTRDGSRPGYYGPDAGHENDPGHGSNAPGGGNGGDGNMQDYMTDYATNVGKTAKSTGGFKGDGFFGGIVDTVKDYVTGGGLIGLAARGLNKAFGPKSFEDTYGYATDYQGSPGPSQVNEDNNRGGDGRDLYAATNQYTAPTPIEEEDITTITTNPDFIQRFMVKEPYRQAQGLDFLAQNKAIANMINNLYT